MVSCVYLGRMLSSSFSSMSSSSSSSSPTTILSLWLFISLYQITCYIPDNHYVIIGVSLVAALLIGGSVIVVFQYQRQRKTSRNGPRLADYGSGGLLLGPVQYLREDRLRKYGLKL